MRLSEELEKFETFKSDMEFDIKCFIDGKIKEFESKTGISPHGLEVEFVDVTAIEDKRGVYTPSVVKIHTKI